MRAATRSTGGRITAGLVGYAAVLWLSMELGQSALDAVWSGVTAVVGVLVTIGNDLVAFLDGATVGSVLPFILGVFAVGLAGIAALLIWPLTVESTATEHAGQVAHTQRRSGEVIPLPVAGDRHTPSRSRRAA